MNRPLLFFSHRALTKALQTGVYFTNLVVILLTFNRDKFRRGEVYADPCSYPAFLWKGCDGPLDPKNVHDGFLQDAALLKVSLIAHLP
jgi:hypothetical protein